MAASLTLADLGEQALVEHLIHLLPQPQRDVLLGPGDDCAMVNPCPDASAADPNVRQLLKVDSVVEGVHFRPDEDMRRVGWKALCRAISDVGAMGGRPRHALISLAADPATLVERVSLFYHGLIKAALEYGVAIVGGETGKTSGPLVCSVFLTGDVDSALCLTRACGAPGDRLFVTGQLGGSLESGWHLDFTPRLRQGQWLATKRFPSAMMDLSDGLAADAARLARASGCGLQIFPESVPCRAGVSVESAFCDGEDFELLLAVPEERAGELEHEWKQAFPQLALSDIGKLTAADEGLQPRDFLTKGGYNHFQ